MCDGLVLLRNIMRVIVSRKQIRHDDDDDDDDDYVLISDDQDPD